MKHIQSAKVEKISKCFIFKNLIIFWENSEWYGAQKKSTKLRWIIQYTAIFGRYGSTAKIVYFEPDFSQTWNFQVPSNIIYHFWKFQQNGWCSFWEMVKKAPKNAHICKILKVPDWNFHAKNQENPKILGAVFKQNWLPTK